MTLLIRKTMISLVAAASLFLFIFKIYFEKLIQSVQYNPPIPLNIRWKFNEERDIMWFFGARSQTPHPEMTKIHKQKVHVLRL